MKCQRRPLGVLLCNLEKRYRKLANEADVLSGRFGELVEDCVRFFSEFTPEQKIASSMAMSLAVHSSPANTTAGAAAASQASTTLMCPCSLLQLIGFLLVLVYFCG